MINWGQKKYGPQAPGIQIGPRVKSGGSRSGGTVMSKAGTPLKPSKPMAKPTPGRSYRPDPGKPKQRKVNYKAR